MSKASLLGLSKKLNIPRRNCLKTKEELEEATKDTIEGCKKIIFDSDTPVVCIACLDELRKQQIIDEYDQKLMEDAMRKVAWEELQKDIAIDGDTMIDKRKGEVLDPKVDSTYWKEKLYKIDFYSL